MTEHDPRQRINYEGEIEPVFGRVAADYELGKVTGFMPVAVGYEDYNVVLDTETGEHFVKVFAGFRESQEVERLERIMHAVINKGVRHPKIYEHQGSLVYKDTSSNLSMMVMEYVSGQTFYDMHRVPNDEELKAILHQAVLINTTNIKPAQLYDSWSILSIEKVYREIKQQISTEDRNLVEGALDEFSVVNYSVLPHCFVHGDLTRSNVIKSKSGEMYVLDFSVANWYPRVQELAVIIGNLMNNDEVTEPYLDTTKKVVRMYVEAGGELTEAEMKVLPAYARMGFAAELVGALKEGLENPNVPTENDHWLELGRAGLWRSLK